MATRSGRRTDYNWQNVGDVETGHDLSTASAVFGTTALAFSNAQTIMRVRGKVGVVLDTGGVDESTMIICGLLVMNADAFAVGDAAAPDMVLNAVDEASWLWQGALFVNSGAEAAVITEFLSDNIEIDTKAMRRVKAGQVLAFVFQTGSPLTTDQAGTLDLTYYLHVLTGD